MHQTTRDILTPLADEIRDLAVKAGNRILEIYETDFSVEQKSDHSPLTIADMAAHEIICSGLAQLTQDIPVLSEESSEIPFT